VTTLKTEAPTGKAWRLDKWFPQLDGNIISLFKSYDSLIEKNNSSLNLVSSKTLPFSDVLHFADCILATEALFGQYTNINHIHDLSGNGLPGFVIAALHKNTKVVCLEQDKSKSDFLRSAAAELGLKNVEVIQKSIESLDANSVQFAISRGTSNLSRAILSARKAFKVGGTYFHLKGEQWGMEISEIPTQLCSVWAPSLVRNYTLPIGDFKLAIIKTDKIS